MKCEKSERWISDALDGALPEKKRRILEEHLAGCAACRAYQERLRRINHQAAYSGIVPVSAGYWEEFSFSLNKKLQHQAQRIRARRPFGLDWKWAGLAAPLLLAIIIGFVLFRSRGEGLRHDIFSFEACLERLDQEMGNDAGLAAELDRLVAGSIEAASSLSDFEESPFFAEDPFFWENLSEDDLALVEQEIKKEIKS